MDNDQLQFEQCCDAKRGNTRLPPHLEELKSWVSETYSVNAFHVVLEQFEGGPSKGKPRLNIVLDSTNEKIVDRLGSPLVDVREAILSKFSAVVVKSQLVTDFDPKQRHLVFTDFCGECMDRVSESVIQLHAKQIVNEFAHLNLWTIESAARWIVVYYQTENDKQLFHANGTSDQVRKRCFEFVKQYDEFNYFEIDSYPISFGTKENIDKNYHGSTLFLYK